MSMGIGRWDFKDHVVFSKEVQCGGKNEDKIVLPLPLRGWTAHIYAGWISQTVLRNANTRYVTLKEEEGETKRQQEERKNNKNKKKKEKPFQI